MDNAEEAVGALKLQYLTDTPNQYQAAAIESFIQSFDGEKKIHFEKAMDLETAKKLAGADKISAVIYFTGDHFKSRYLKAQTESVTERLPPC
jgi:hypothetical protein